jgi:hypothetical protein
MPSTTPVAAIAFFLVLGAFTIESAHALQRCGALPGYCYGDQCKLGQYGACRQIPRLVSAKIECQLTPTPVLHGIRAVGSIGRMGRTGRHVTTNVASLRRVSVSFALQDSGALGACVCRSHSESVEALQLSSTAG